MGINRGTELFGLAKRPLPAFIAVGAVGFALDAGLMLLTIKALACHPIGARLVSFPVAVTCTWLLNRHWAFRGRGLQSRSVEYVGYFAIQVAGAALNVGVFLGCLLLWPLLASVPLLPLTFGAAVALLFNYALLRRALYRREARCRAR
jgi:putative flippase GtrA